MKKILVLGCAFGSDNLILEAKKMGLYVVNADYYETTPAKKLSDESWLIDLRDIDALEAKCREENVEVIACGCQGFVITTSIELCKRLNLPIYCSDPRGYNLSRNKSVFKDHCEAIGAPTAKRYYLSDDLTPEELSKIEYPVVVKPVDKGGNTGISFCDNEEQLRAAYALARSVSNNPTIVCERKLHGPEWVANYVLANGEAKLLYLGREYHQPGEGANLYSMIVNSPFRLKQYMEEVNDKVIELFRTAHFKDGIAWVELMYDEGDKKFYLIEPGYRFSSETSYRLQEKVDGFSSLKWYLETALGIEHNISELPETLGQPYRECVTSYHLFSSCAGTSTKIVGAEELLKNPNIEIDVPKPLGSKYGYHVCMGLVRFYAKDVYELVSLMKEVNEKFSILNENGENMFIRFTNYDEVVKEYEEGLKDYNMI